MKLKSGISALAPAAATASGLLRQSYWQDPGWPVTDMIVLFLLKRKVRALPEKRVLELAKRIGARTLTGEVGLKYLPKEIQLRALRSRDLNPRLV